MPQDKFREYFEIFSEIARMISTILNDQEVMNTIVTRLPEVLEVDAATIRLLDNSTNSFVLGAAHGISMEYLSRDTIDTQDTMTMIMAGQPVVSDKSDGDQDPSTLELMEKEGICSVLSLPIQFQGNIIGVMRLLSKSHRQFSHEEIAFTMALAEQSGMAISNARIFSELENQIDFLKEVHEISQLFNSTLDLDELLVNFTTKLPSVLAMKGCVISLHMFQDHHSGFHQANGVSKEFAKALVDTRWLKEDAYQNEVLTVYDVANDNRIKQTDLFRDEGIRSLMLVPIKSNGDLLGKLIVLSDEFHCFTSNEVNFIRTVAQTGSAAIHNARTYRQINMLFTQIEESERFLSDILNSIRAQLIVVDGQQRVVLANNLFLQRSQMQERDVLGSDYQALFQALECSAADYLVPRVLDEGVSVDQIYKCESNGQTSWFERTAIPMVDENGKLEFILEITRDISVEHRLKEEQMQRVKLEGVVEMAGAAAHEINSPLFAALGTAQLLQDELDDEEQREELETIIRNLKSIGKLTGKMVEETGFEIKEYVGNTQIVDLR